MNGDDLENEFMQLAYESGHSVIFNDESKKDSNRNDLSALDMTFDGVVMDIKSITEKKLHYGSAIKGKFKQFVKYNHREDIERKADSLCIYFHDADMYSPNCITDGIKWIHDNNFKNPGIKNIICALRTEHGLKIIHYNI